MGVVTPIDERHKSIRQFVQSIEESKSVPQRKDWENFATMLKDVGMTPKSISVRTAQHYGVNQLLNASDIMKIPGHMRGYGIAGAMDKGKEFSYLKSLYEKGMITYVNLIQAVEGWIVGDPNKMVSSYYEIQSFCPDRWAKNIIETALWGDSLRAAAKLAIIEKRHTDWACNLIRFRQVGDPSNAILDLFYAGIILNLNYALEVIYGDKVGCPASAAKRLRDDKGIRKDEFKAIVSMATSGDPALVVQNSDLSDDIDFAMKIAEKDLSVNSPKLAIWLMTNRGANVQKVEAVVKKSKFYSEIDYLSMEMLTDRLVNPIHSEMRQATKERNRVN